jgi:hypothetical protein
MNPSAEPNPPIKTIVFLVIAILGCLIAFVTINNQKNTVPGEGFFNPYADQIPSVKHSTYPDFKGLDGLLAVGVADDQITGLKYALAKFDSTLNPPFGVVTIPGSSIKAIPRDRNSLTINNVVNFKLIVGSTSYDAHLEYGGLSDVRLMISDQSGKQIFDSGTININSQTPAV